MAAVYHIIIRLTSGGGKALLFNVVNCCHSTASFPKHKWFSEGVPPQQALLWYQMQANPNFKAENTTVLYAMDTPCNTSKGKCHA